MKKHLIIDVCKTHTYPIYVFDGDTLVYEPDSNYTDYTLLPLDMIRQKQKALNLPRQHSYTLPFLTENNDHISTYLEVENLPLFFVISTNQTCNYSIIIGPLSSSFVDFTAWHSFCKKIQIPCSADYKIKTYNPFILSNILVVLHELLADTTVTVSSGTLSNIGNMSSVFDHSSLQQETAVWNDSDSEHTSYQLETYFIRCIREGRLDDALKLADFFDRAKVGNMSGNSFKQEEYMSVIGITLYTRVVIEQGVSPEKAYSTSDYFMKQISAAKDIPELHRLSHRALETFVSILKGNEDKIIKPVHVENAKNYISRHLRSPLTVAEVAHAIGISSSHLSSLFQKHEGISVKQYILENKLQAVANMLRFSDCDISTIGEYFYFSSASHLGTAFRKQYGCTPSEYRKKYFSPSFFEGSPSFDRKPVL